MPDRPELGALEQRALAPDTDPLAVQARRLHGVIPFGVPSADMGGWTEVMDPGCLAGADLSGLVATVHHDPSRILGRHPTTLQVEDRADGLYWTVDLPSGPTGEDVRVAVERGDIRASSWRMLVERERWEGNVRHVEAVRELRDVAVTATPAYGDEARAEYRSAPQPRAPTPPAAPSTPPAATPAPEPEEATVPDQPTGGLRVEDRAATSADHEPQLEQRVMDAIRTVRQGETRSLTTATNSARALTPTEQGTFVWDRLRASAVMLAAGVRVLPTQRREISWPKITSDVQPDWYAETAVIAAGDPGLGTLTATPHKLAHRVEFANEVIDDSEPDAVDVVSDHLATMLGLKLDASLLYGNPASNADSVRGLRYVSGIQSISMGANGAALTNYDPILRAVGLLRAANVPGPYAVVLNPRTATELSLLKGATGSNEQLARPDDVPPIYSTTTVPVDETKGTATNASSVFVFAPGQLVLVRRLDAEIELDRSRLFDRDMSELRGKTRADLLVSNPVAVVRIDGVIPPA